ncbi:hypothetical protein ACFC58_06130 [Kitasatospora purpeofusca]|uniref:hypothetical protein n=1 Tax=Kitasatospora purpeofusca TaxID=67352 RepID=UPI0035D670AF
MNDHQFFDVIETIEVTPFSFVVVPDKVTRVCVCQLAPEDERPTTPCPLDQERRTEQLGRLATAFRAALARAEEEPKPVRRELLGWAAGDYVSWDGRDGASTVRITGVSTRYGRFIDWESTDGYEETEDDTVFMSLEAKTARWRRATDEERARFNRLYRPAPQNWN